MLLRIACSHGLQGQLQPEPPAADGHVGANEVPDGSYSGQLGIDHGMGQLSLQRLVPVAGMMTSKRVHTTMI